MKQKHAGEDVDFSKFDLTDESVARLKGVIKELREFEADGKKSLPTSLQKIQKLTELGELALAIRDGIQALDDGSYLWLDAELAFVPGPEGVPQAEGASGKLGSHIVFMQRMACNLALATRRAADGTEKRRGKTGRKSVIGVYAGFIACVAVALKADHIKAGRGGKFEAVCEVVFSTAGVPAKPEGAIKYFLKEIRPEYQQRGHCL